MFQNFINNKKGNIAVIFAIASLPIMAGVGGAVDYFSAVNKSAEVQNALDAAGLAAGQAYLSGIPDEEIATIAEDFFRSNVRGARVGHTSFAFTNSAIIIDHPQWEEFAETQQFATSTYLLLEARFQHEAMLRYAGNWDIGRRSVVRIAQGMPACVLALDPTASSALKIQGSTEARFRGCVMAANSKSESAVYRGGSAQLEAECVITSGNSNGLDSSNVKFACDEPLHRQAPSRDPLSGVKVPSYTACKSVPSSRRKTLSPGTYCEQVISGDVTLQSGVYVLRGGRINLGGNGRLEGADEGVTIFLTEGAEISVGANQIVSLLPPKNGPYAGITIYQAAGNTKTVSLQGTAGSQLSGFIYAPDAHIIYAGNNSMTGGLECLRLVGRTIEMTGNSDVTSDCEAELGGRQMQAGRFVGLVK